MAKKITQLTSLAASSVAGSDVCIIEDVSAVATKKITVTEARKVFVPYAEATGSAPRKSSRSNHESSADSSRRWSLRPTRARLCSTPARVPDRKSTRLNSSHVSESRMPSSA